MEGESTDLEEIARQQEVDQVLESLGFKGAPEMKVLVNTIRSTDYIDSEDDHLPDPAVSQIDEYQRIAQEQATRSAAENQSDGRAEWIAGLIAITRMYQQTGRFARYADNAWDLLYHADTLNRSDVWDALQKLTRIGVMDPKLVRHFDPSLLESWQDTQE